MISEHAANSVPLSDRIGRGHFGNADQLRVEDIGAELLDPIIKEAVQDNSTEASRDSVEWPGYQACRWASGAERANGPWSGPALTVPANAAYLAPSRSQSDVDRCSGKI